MRKFFLVGLIAVMAVAVAALAAEMPEKVTLKDCADTKTPVEFNHKAHVATGAACIKCHHTTEGLTAETVAKATVAKCGSCHVKPEKAETPMCSGKKPTDNPYHIVCITCHKEAIAAKADSKAPKLCTGCHPKAASWRRHPPMRRMSRGPLPVGGAPSFRVRGAHVDPVESALCRPATGC